MTSTFTVSPAALHDGRMPDPRNGSPPHPQSHMQPTTPLDSSHLSPFSSAQVHSNSTSPAHISNTPAESTSTLSHYHSSDLSDFDEGDPFFGVDFSAVDGGTPSFLDDPAPSLSHTNSFGRSSIISSFPASPPVNNVADVGPYPLSPEQTTSLYTVSPRSERRPNSRPAEPYLPDSVSPQELQKPFKPSPVTTQSTQSVTQLTPSNSGSGRSSEDGLAPAAVAMPCHSPRVTVSYWGKDNKAPVHALERSFVRDGDESPATVRGGIQSAGDLISSGDQNAYSASVPRDDNGNWQRDPSTGHRGLDPKSRTSEEVPSVNEIMTKREIEEKNQEVDKWLAHNIDNPPSGQRQQELISSLETQNVTDEVEDVNIPLGGDTENKYIDGQTYFLPNGGEMSQEDVQIIHGNRNWADAPMIHPITRDPTIRYQPETSQEAIQKFERMCQDNESIISKAATWGTRRRSLPSLLDVEGITSGNLLKKLSIGKSESRRPSFIKELRELVRKPSANLKRARSNHDEDGFRAEGFEKRDSHPHLIPPGRSGSWGISKKPTPSINTALVAVGGSAASIGSSQHARSGSISATPLTSPKSPFAGLTVRTTMRRPRSKSDLPKHGNNEPQSNLAEMWKKTGGPPVAYLAKPAAAPDPDDDDDDEDEFYADNDMKGESGKIIDNVTPTFSGFRQHILHLNPGLEKTNSYLVDRIAHQQIVRYKTLLNSKGKHIQLGANCSCGTLCIALGGTAAVIDQKGDARGIDPLSTRFDASDGDVTPIEGAISQESFPQDIPMPPTATLPAEFECQLCYQAKKFQKPSDWTKHVHEDVQPFTCTWDKCRDPKIFKRKADWVRHENEGHRHLEWWTCDVDDCRHICYRRDNFLQHLVREHKFTEPKVKTKAAMKRAGGIDPTWQKVEKCHEETSKKPQDEPCRFCGKSFPTWKKLTVHLAKHMEQISLPVLRLVAAKELDADTIISPVQDPPPRQMAPLPVKREEAQPSYSNAAQYNPNAGMAAMQQPAGLAYQSNSQGHFMYPVMPNTQFAQPFYGTGYESIGQSLESTPMDFQSVNAVNQGFGQHQQYQNIPVTTSSYVTDPNQYVSMPPNVEPFPALNNNPLGLHTTAGAQMSQMGAQLGPQMGYDGLMDPSTANTDPYTPQGSVSPYSHSPHQGQQSAFYPPQ